MIIKSRKLDELLNDLALQQEDTQTKETVEDLIKKESEQEDKMAH
jgi:hypothetical protein